MDTVMGEVFTWGSGEMGQLGCSPSDVKQLPHDIEGYPYQPIPTPVKALSHLQITQVAGGDGHSIAVTVDGRVFAWGACACGQLGLSDINDMPTDSEGYPYQPEPKLISSLLDVSVVQIACGDAHTAALTKEGLVLTWGGGGCGQLGHPNTGMMPKDEDGCPYQPAPRVVEFITNQSQVVVKQIACGKAHTVAISEEGRLFTWGAGACGQLGHPDTSNFPYDEDGYPYHPTPKEVMQLMSIRLNMAACGDLHTLVLADDGSVYCFGGGSLGQLGLGNIKDLPVDVDDCPFMPVPRKIDGLRNVRIVQIACGDSHSMALTDKGELYGWGVAACGQLGIEHLNHLPRDAEDMAYEPDPQLIRQLQGKHIIQVACGEAHTLVLTTTGSLYSFGVSRCGQLGIPVYASNDNIQNSKPMQFQSTPKLTVPLISRKILAISCGGVHNIAIAEPLPLTLPTDLYEFYTNGLFVDTTFQFTGIRREESIQCHRIVLVSKSNYFRSLLQNNNTVHITCERFIFSKLIDYFYLNDINILAKAIGQENSLCRAKELLQLPCTRDLPEVHQLCESAIMSFVRPHMPTTLPLDIGEQLEGLVFFPNGKVALLQPEQHQLLLQNSIVLQNQVGGGAAGRSMRELLQELNSEEFSDVTLMIEGQPIHSHRLVLAARSNFFRALYSHSFKESKEKVVELSDVQYDSIYTLLSYMYSDELEIQFNQITELLFLCDRFSVPSLKARCEIELAAHIDIENAAMLYKYAKMYQCSRLREVTLVFIEENFREVIETASFEDLDKDSILEIMRFKKFAL